MIAVPKVITKNFDLTEILFGEKRIAPSPFGFHQRILGR
jgi:hypothetical protein